MDNTTLRNHSLLILDHALQAVAPQRAMAATLSRKGSVVHIGNTSRDLSHYDKLVVIGAGKAGAAMAVALEDLLGEEITEGVVVVKEGHSLSTQTIHIMEAGHPIPDEMSIAAGLAMLACVRRNRGPKTLFFFLLSGGASSLLVAPVPGISLGDKQEVSRLLLAAGANIGEINAIRKHLSLLKGGGLAKELQPADTVALVISDVVGDHLGVIGSGPCVKDDTTWSQCREILTRYRLTPLLPQPVQQRFAKGVDQVPVDTPPSRATIANPIEHHIIADNLTALLAAASKAESLGYRSLILSSTIEGETLDIANMHAALAREITASSHPLPPPCCLISGGETTVTLEAKYGTGGRNQEFGLAAAHAIHHLPSPYNVVILSAGTDGTDGPTDAAGAIVDTTTLDRARSRNLDTRDALHTHNAYPVLKSLGDLVVTGPTLTNVMDIRLVLVG